MATSQTASNPKTLYNFTEQGQGSWQVEDDVVMGGRSQSHLEMTEEGWAHFHGEVSLENNGGFCSIHWVSKDKAIQIDNNHSAFVLKIKGDGKSYSFRVKNPNGRHLYGYEFSTQAGEWQTIQVPFNKMEASFHGEPVNVPNYAGENVLEMQLLIGNGKEESFELFVESIGVG
jgi:hypothetical protein